MQVNKEDLSALKEIKDEVKKEKPLCISNIFENLMLTNIPESKPIKIKKINKTYNPSDIYTLSDGLKSIKYNDACTSKRDHQNIYLPKITRPHPTTYKMQPWAARRAGKKLLVLDLDQTLCDFGPKPTDKIMVEDRRPHLTKFLSTVYEYYDIVIWSATENLLVLDKIHRLKLFSEHSKILFYLNIDDMLKMKLRVDGKYKIYSVKPLESVWSKAQWYSSKNTLLIDDRPINFYVNPKNGLQIKPYDRKNFTKDKELLFLSTYLVSLAKHCTDFTTVNHKNWQSYKQKK